jgi:hypothetical protein
MEQARITCNRRKTEGKEELEFDTDWEREGLIREIIGSLRSEIEGQRESGNHRKLQSDFPTTGLCLFFFKGNLQQEQGSYKLVPDYLGW